MTVEARPWGALAGRDYSLFTLRHAGLTLVLTDYGARVVQLCVPAPDGALADIVLGFDDIGSYAWDRAYVGATVGRFGNRIRGGRFTLDGVPHQVSCNEGGNSLHGGTEGFDRRPWAATFDPAGAAIRFTLVSPDGDQGFPGELAVTTDFALTDDRRLVLEMRARTTRPTLCNLVHHGYFNLAGHDAGDVLGQELQLLADFYTPVDGELLPTGEVRRVAGSPFDFRGPRAIGRRDGDGFDHNWCLRGEPGRLRVVALARDPVSGRGFELSTTEPGLQFYSGGHLAAPLTGKGGAPYQRFAGFALETQKFPDGPNLGHLPQSRLAPGDDYRHRMEFRFLP